ncbi:MAG: pyruvate dehydrogenase complex dihydrolipoamide acetyltransferase [Rhodospirillales bacterium]|nr:pyruvate dehydrogenase complex dihydrolipoamide acetyltransferase [Rhodospirillales bacterium]
MTISILMPAMSPTMTEGKLAKWLKKEGDTVAYGDLLAEIETDKATMELEAADDGILGKILVGDGTDGVPVNSPIAVLLEEGEDASAADKITPAAAQPAQPPQPEAAPSAPAPQATATPAPAKDGARIAVSPLARRLAGQAGLNLAALSGSGPKGRIVKRDIEAALAAGSVPTAVAGPNAPLPALLPGERPYTDVPNSSMRKVIAQRLTESSLDIPHFFLTIECQLDNLLALRGDLNTRSPEGEGAYKISVNDFIVRAAGLALRKVPGANSSWGEEAIRLYDCVDVAIAVSTDGGLITPIVRDADQKGLAEISIEMKDLGARARDGNLAPEEYQGGGFTISNLGMFGIHEFSAIINPPQSCILAVGAGEARPVVKDGALGIATVMSCTLSSDHRSVDGVLGAQFLAAFKGLIEDPLTMLL